MTFLACIVIFLLCVISLQLRGIAGDLRKPKSAPESFAAASSERVANEILQLQADGTHVSQGRHLGVTEEVKAALRTPGMAVRWGHNGVVEHGQE